MEYTRIQRRMNEKFKNDDVEQISMFFIYYHPGEGKHRISLYDEWPKVDDNEDIHYYEIPSPYISDMAKRCDPNFSSGRTSGRAGEPR